MTPSQGVGAQRAQSPWHPVTRKWSGKSQLISLQAIANSPLKTTFKSEKLRKSWKDWKRNFQMKIPKQFHQKSWITTTWEIRRKIAFKWYLAREWEPRGAWPKRSVPFIGDASCILHSPSSCKTSLRFNAHFFGASQERLSTVSRAFFDFDMH